ncbi:HAMP domain-containing protein [candidate division KSB3 bacterium]|uniref:histidine kinase n=1 Tax=candidate division KSB3 bacterium TaxID=2044937 RepID=A0A9D5Q5B2_9BACT|nr:HAMP domain-containing protein [candidate division KSB3 bacterium]MBD3324644.1 HAMP domain-containing protein [candidate division KSB3 bacterium]
MSMIKSIRLQLTLWYIASISLLVLLFGGIAFFSFKSILVHNLDQTLYNGGKILDASLAEYRLKHEHDPRSLYEPSAEGDEFFVDEIDEEIREIFFINTAYIQLLTLPHTFGSEPQLIVKSESLENRRLPLSHQAYQTIQDSPYATETLENFFAFPLRVLSLRVHDMEGRPYILQIGMSLQDIQGTLRNLLSIFAVLFPALLVILSVLGYVFMKRAFSPVKRMVDLTKRITAEDLSLRLEPLDSRDEIGELAATLNDMIARLERSFNQIKQFSGDVAHELRTPLTELKCNAEVALRHDRPPAEYREALQNVIADVEYLQHIIEDLLLLARIDTQRFSLSLTPVALNEVFFEVFEGLHPLAMQKQLALQFEEVDAVDIPAERGLLKEVVTNVMLNAIQYTPPGGAITFSLHQVNGQAVFTITDTGLGIPEEHLPYIFDRFYRVEQSRSHDTGGSGLGLAIVHKIVTVHHGTISVQSTEGQGTTFQVTLPCA